MAGIRQAGTASEAEVGAHLRLLGLHYRKNVRALPGSPDFANRKGRWVVFVHGCFWHHHSNCRKATIPKTNTDFWLEKFRANRRRDAQAISKLRELGYEVVVVWQCQTHALDPRLGHRLIKSQPDADGSELD